ncbi:sulfane dehydrogenase subunit SoxC [Inquilinus ginsengisoli]|uniref:molybdopterin-dependent oxidoreductase n=1 Tax=Inquilinus ginsengisoli TaxID=363840 RepID=UPI003D1AFEC9
MNRHPGHASSGHLIGPARPPMEPAEGVRRIKLRPHETTAPVTATDDLPVIAHLGIPRIEPGSWSLRIDGLVGRALTLGLADLRSRPKVVVEAMHQCCGSPFEPHVPTRRVANVRWGGVDLAALLEEAGIDPRARFLWSYGLDGGDFAGTACDWYVKDLPLERLPAGGVLIAYELNGVPLSAEHGAPARLVVPGYYGTNSVKWLWRLRLADRRADGVFAAELYNDPGDAADIAAGGPARRPVWAIAPEAIIVAPAPDAVLAADQPTEIWGWSWSFRGIQRVEVSVDGGTSYRQAALEPRRGWAWQRFSLPWRPGDRGAIQLCVRAFEADGTTQPVEGARNAIHSVPVSVR